MPKFVDPRLKDVVRSVNDEIADRAIRHSTFFMRLQTHEANKVVGFLNDKVLPDVIDRVERAVAKGTSTGRLRDLALTVNETLRGGFTATRDLLSKDLKDIAISEAEWVRSVIQQSVPLELVLRVPPAPLLRSIINNNSVEGKMLGKGWNEWWRDLNATTQRNIMTQINIGAASGDSVAQIVQRLRGTRDANYANGAFQTTRRQAEALTRTSVNHVGTQARKETYKANSDIIKGEKWVSTLDARTSDICMSLDGRTFKVGEGPQPPAHINCRSIRVPITKSAAELGLKGVTIPKLANQRAARVLKPGVEPTAKNLRDFNKTMTGKAPADITYEKWIKGQPANVQNEILGKGRAELLRRGNVPMSRYIDDKGRPLSLKQLQDLEKKIIAKEIPKKPRGLPGEVKNLDSKRGGGSGGKGGGSTGGSGGSPAKPKPKPPTTSPTQKSTPPEPKKSEPAKPKLADGKTVRKQAEDVVNKAKQSEQERFALRQRIKEEVLREQPDLKKYSALLQREVDKRVSQTSMGALKSHVTNVNLQTAQTTREIHRLLEIPEDARVRIKLDIPEGASSITPAMKGKAREAVEWLTRMTEKSSFEGGVHRVKMYSTKGIKGGRAYYSYGEGAIRMGNFNKVQTYVHELGHSYEHRSFVINQKAQKFLASRTKGETAQSLKKLTGSGYEADELAKPDKFFDPYVGKIYGSTASEITSMGVELMYSNPVRLLERDPEMFEFIVDLLRGL